ncbi:GntR family transcriptional regulator [Bosea caraganae]|uniref:GntR family transcriptional regulator n=1 Tax=Bosea caraganae TaxID=2763117 RepID=A0A370L793_9HYPH|nr:GntR family transcriptional regulator [Bosea caraganae]RDJ25472.1 GntR family transcriptional regulator [Bosea caraganae]RDJ25743.1 GntR family transcriptional regulator [Bosea caraganae]
MTESNDTTPLASLLAHLPTPEPGRRKGKLHSTTVAVLRNMIVTGVLAPGTRLNERELCEQFSVSRTPVREAIKTLTQDGLLRALPNYSAVVSELDPDELSSLIDVVVVIEGLAGELAVAHVTDEDIAEIGLLHYQMLLHHTRDELPGYFEANKAFHRRIVELSHNSILVWVWELLALRVDRARFSSNRWPTRWKAAIQEHQLILDALSARDGEKLARTMREHVRNGLSGLLTSLKAATEGGAPQND